MLRVIDVSGKGYGVLRDGSTVTYNDGKMLHFCNEACWDGFTETKHTEPELAMWRKRISQ